jgi:hypothetical protein
MKVLLTAVKLCGAAGPAEPFRCRFSTQISLLLYEDAMISTLLLVRKCCSLQHLITKLYPRHVLASMMQATVTDVHASAMAVLHHAETH